MAGCTRTSGCRCPSHSRSHRIRCCRPLLAAQPCLTQQETEAWGRGAVCSCFSSKGEVEKGKTQSRCKGTSETAALRRDVAIRGKQLNSLLKAFFPPPEGSVAILAKQYPCQSVANLVKGKKRLGSDRFDSLSDAWCSALLLI